MISIKIQCGCGQRYAFDVEPVNGLMPHAVACPVCGADGTAAANAFMAQSLPPQPVAAPAPTAPRRSATPTRQVDYVQIGHETRARIMWGDSREQATKFAMLQGLSAVEARALVEPMFAERAATIRRNGFGKIFAGILLICVPIGSYLFFLNLGVIPLKIFAVTVMVGLYGAYLVVQGTFMAIAPKLEPGDVSEQ
jgi:hypothetical protein